MSEGLKTKELFYENPMLAAFDAQVLSCAPLKEGYGVILDRTAFYPEGGGQPGDQGGIGGAAVLDTRKIGGGIVHITDSPVAAGSNVSCQLDFRRRFIHMQNHTGEHILSGILKMRYGCENVGFHMGTDFVTIDTDIEVSSEQLQSAEEQANEAIYKNLPISAAYPPEEVLANIDYRSKGSLSGPVRIVDIPGYDQCACCGTHCNYTGEVGLVKVLTSQRYKGGSRIYMLSGHSALADYSKKNESIYDLSLLLSAKPAEVASAVHQLHAERNQLKHALAELKKNYFEMKAKEFPMGEKSVLVFEEGLSSEELRRFCLVLAERAETVFLFTPTGDNGYKYAIGSKTRDVRELGKKINAQLKGKGGGQQELVQGSVNASEVEIRVAVDQIKKD